MVLFSTRFAGPDRAADASAEPPSPILSASSSFFFAWEAERLLARIEGRPP
jgi:hypothetical protein